MYKNTSVFDNIFRLKSPFKYQFRIILNKKGVDL